MYKRQDISEGLARAACAGEVDGEIVDLRTVLDKDCTLNIITASDEEGLRVIRHTASHVLAQAVKNLFPDAKITIGPAIDDGFYYDFDVEKPFTAEELRKIEAEMKKIVKENAELEQFINEKIAERAGAKKAKDFARADAIRDELLARGITIKDTREGVVWERNA